ncbi:MAG: hypothetical protein KDK66_08805, partial [Deltaproteobacteria bacterium]|nr:hypothetical protein [Deltaproteobacteria bacterium]
DANTNPTLNLELGFKFPLLRRTTPQLSLISSLQGIIFLESDTFESGSVKLYEVSGFLLEWKRFDLSLLARFSWLDTLDFVPEVTIEDQRTGLLSDVEASFLLSFGFHF